MDQRLLNGKPKVTIIQRFNHSVILIRFGGKTKKHTKGLLNTLEFKDLKAAIKFIEEQGYEINISHIHPGQVERA
jgi:hypothetical protein